MQCLNKASGAGGPTVPPTVGMLFSLIPPICEFAAAEPWKSEKACWEGAALFHILLALWKRSRRGCKCLCNLGERQVGSVRTESVMGLGSSSPAGRCQQPALSTCLGMQLLLQHSAKLLGKPLPQQMSVSQSSCRVSGRRRSAISLEPGGPGPQHSKVPTSQLQRILIPGLRQIA